MASLRKKIERAKKIEMASSADEVLMEEIKEYKASFANMYCRMKVEGGFFFKTCGVERFKHNSKKGSRVMKVKMVIGGLILKLVVWKDSNT